MMIRCSDMEQFMEVIFGLVKRGMTFDASADSLTIKVLGGF